MFPVTLASRARERERERKLIAFLRTTFPGNEDGEKRDAGRASTRARKVAKGTLGGNSEPKVTN